MNIGGIQLNALGLSSNSQAETNSIIKKMFTVWYNYDGNRTFISKIIPSIKRNNICKGTDFFKNHPTIFKSVKEQLRIKRNK